MPTRPPTNRGSESWLGCGGGCAPSPGPKTSSQALTALLLHPLTFSSKSSCTARAHCFTSRWMNEDACRVALTDASDEAIGPWMWITPVGLETPGVSSTVDSAESATSDSAVIAFTT